MEKKNDAAPAEDAIVCQTYPGGGGGGFNTQIPQWKKRSALTFITGAVLGAAVLFWGGVDPNSPSS
ncbi:MAG: hypothetical protein LBG72_09590, partial [Spirochaetaceae bacterium]|nr:hypothetical protein [Spirochaetaceae bacterium]